MKLRINEKEFPLLSARAATENMKNYRRDVISLTIEATYSESAAEFTDGATFTVVDDSVAPEEEFEYTDHTMAGSITDHRDGTVMVKMGKANTAEQDALEAKNEAEKKTQKVSMDLVILAGKSLSGEPNEISELRKSFEAACSKLADSDILIAPSLAPSWDIGQNIAQGERRYYRPNGTLHKALKPHTASFENGPGNTEYWEEV